MNKFAWVAMGLLVAAVAVGCNESAKDGGAKAPAAGGIVAVVDMAKVATDIGQETEAAKNIDTYRTNLLNQIKPKVAKLQTDSQAEVDKYNAFVKTIKEEDRATEVNKKRLEEAIKPVVKLKEDYDNLIKDGDAKLNKYRQDLASAFNHQIEPVLKQVCDKEGVRVLIPRFGGGYVAPDSDLTNKVIDAAKAAKLSLPVAPPPVAAE